MKKLENLSNPDIKKKSCKICNGKREYLRWKWALTSSSEIYRGPWMCSRDKMRAMIGGEQWETYLKRILKKSKGVTGASLMRYYNANCKKKFRYGLWGPFCENGKLWWVRGWGVGGSLSLSATRQCGHATVKVIVSRGREKMMGSFLFIYFEKMKGGSWSWVTVQNSGK